MFKRLFQLSICLAFCASVFAGVDGSHRMSSTGSVHVRGYTTKNGTYVAPHARRSRGSAPSAVTARNDTHAYRSGRIAPGYSSHSSVNVDSRGRIKRSTAAKNGFKRERPCPSTGRSSGSCPGYVIDHVRPLECGGADAPSNMQWQTVAEGKAKDKTERYCR